MAVAEIEAIRVKVSPLAEVPAVALRAAVGFADSRHTQLEGVWIMPGDEDGQVKVSAASSSRAIELRCEGSCQRPVGLPVLALQAAVRRHRDAHHAVVVETDSGVSLRTFSAACTVVFGLPEAGGSALSLPASPAGGFSVDPLVFNPKLLRQTLEAFEGAGTVQITPFSIGWRIEAVCDDYAGVAIVAGVVL